MRSILRKSKGQKGYTIVELMVVMSVMVIVMQSLAIFLQTVQKGTLSYRQQTYATEKALQMLEELREVASSPGTNIALLTLDYNDETPVAGVATPVYKYCLTTKADITSPGGTALPDYTLGTNALSGNPVSPTNGYVFVRNVSILTDPVDANVRYIYVRIFYAQSNPGPTSPPVKLDPPNSTVTPSNMEPVAEVYGTVRSLSSSNTPTQNMDMYFVALESVPGWWSRTSNLINLMTGAVTNLEARNPGLVITPHWIKTMSYGRDQEYTPEINNNNLANASNAFQKTYIYPGYIDYDSPSAVDDYYYSPSWFVGRIDVDGVMTPNEDYSIADQFNHAVRYPDEKNMYNIYSTIAVNEGSSAPEISLRMLLENLNEASVTNSANTNYINSIVLNLHGEMVPVPPLRNYSDAAKDPLYYQSMSWTAQRDFRVVSQPEQLHYNSSTDSMAVDVYAYDMNPPADDKGNTLIDVATIFIPGATTANLQSIERLQGSSTVPYHWYIYTSYTSSTTSQWASPDSVGGISDTLTGTTPTATWEADTYTTPPDALGGVNSERTGLRIQLYGVSATARAYYGPGWTGP